MKLPEPFAYPISPHTRRHGPRGYLDYKLYKPFLRDEFTFRCVYCLVRETWYPSAHDAFAVEHFQSKSGSPGRSLEYENLYYSCPVCNAFNGTNLLGIDPSTVGLASHLCIKLDGQIEGLTPSGMKMIAFLHLNDERVVGTRKGIFDLLEAKRSHPTDSRIDAIYRRKFGYPANMPDLTKPNPPGGNSLPEGITNSYHARRERGDLPEVY